MLIKYASWPRFRIQTDGFHFQRPRLWYNFFCSQTSWRYWSPSKDDFREERYYWILFVIFPLSRSIHSTNAQKILESMPVVGKSPITHQCQQYLELYETVQHLFHPHWIKEISFMIFIVGLFFLGSLTSIPLLSIACLSVS